MLVRPLLRRAALARPAPPARAFARKGKGKKKAKQDAPAAAATEAVDIWAAEWDAPLADGLTAALERLEATYKTMRGGALTAELFEQARVEAYGGEQPLGAVAQVSITSPTLVTVSCYDPSVAPAAAAALRDLEGLSLNPSVEGGDVSVAVPRPSKEARAALAKAAARAAEEARQRARNVRKDAHDRLKKAPGVPEDDVRAKKSDIDKLVEDASKRVGVLLEEKKKQIEARD